MGIADHVTRRNFLRGRLQPSPEPLRPPWSTNASILEHCIACGKCAESCPENIIAIGADGYPEISFDGGECTFCAACADICPTAVFAERSEAPWRLRPTIGEQCLARNQVFCRSCGDGCPERAISFRPTLGGGAEILIDDEACTGCGACASVCVKGVISLSDCVEPEEAHHV